MDNNEPHEVECDCVFCKQEMSFVFPTELIDEFIKGNVALFAGSGISTENQHVLKSTFYEDIEWELGYENSEKKFPDIMEEYCKQTNGRFKFLSKIKERFKHIRSFPELYRLATRFHRELATYYPIDTIITTNWDTYFEDECGATPFVTSEDLAFWDSPGRKVLKIHGSINNLGSIIATKADYKRCRNELSKGMLGSILKLILATKTVVYIGYSFSDDDFLSINTFVKKEMKGLHKQAYIITPIHDNNNYYQKNGLIPVYTDGRYFIEQVKKHAESKLSDHFIDDSIYTRAKLMLDIVHINHSLLHNGYTCYDNPDMVMCASYQDGLMHGFERVIALRNTGEYSHRCEILRMFKPYDDLRKTKLKEKRYEDVAYIEGYTNAFRYLLLDSEERKEFPCPLFYAFGYDDDLIYFDDYVGIVDELPKLHKSAHKRAKKIVKDMTKHGTEVEFHHRALL